MLDRFVERLAREVVTEDCCNQYAFNWTRDNVARRHNLLAYLRVMQALKPNTMLVFEAPGYRGARITGVPLTSRVIVHTHPFYRSLGLQSIRPKRGQSIGGEATATMVHATLDRLPEQPLLWNSYPFHPHKLGAPNSNRKPRRAETEVGGHYLMQLIDLFGIERVVAVGNSAETTLQRLEIDHGYQRKINRR